MAIAKFHPIAIVEYARDLATVFLPLAGLLGIVIWFANYSIERDAIEQIQQGETIRVAAARNGVTGDFHTIVSDLFVLAQGREIQSYLTGGGFGERAALEHQFVLFAQEKGLYDRLLLLDLAGREVVRVDYHGGMPDAVTPEELEDRSSYAFFREAAALPVGGVYVSPFDLSAEHGSVERPLKPIIRFATPIAGADGEKRGLLVLNYLGADLLGTLRNGLTGSLGQGMLLNEEGYWLYGPNREDEWAFMFARDRTFAADHPGLWEAVRRAQAGQILDADGLVTFTTIHPILETAVAARPAHAVPVVAGSATQAGGNFWKLVTFAPRPLLLATVDWAKDRYTLVFAVAWLIILVLSLAVAFALWGGRRSRDRIKLAARIVEVTTDGALILDPARSVLFVNEAFTTLFGHDPGELAGSDASLLRSERHDPAEYDALWRQVGETGHWQGELWQRRKDGSSFPSWTTVSAIRDRRGRLTNYVAIISDISSRKQLEQALLDAESANRAKSNFIATMSHELRTPLNSILGFSEIIKDRVIVGAGLDRDPEFASYIHESGTHLLEIINDILDLSKIEAGKLTIVPEPVDLEGTLAGCIRLVHARVDERCLAVRLDLPEPVPRLQADVRAFKQIIFNLLSNAIKFTPYGGTIAIRVTAGADGAVGIAVTDTGIGIPADKLDRVFRPFEQVDNQYSRSAGGTGLGLTLVKGLVELHSGTVTLDSAVGVGTTVTLHFPAPRSARTEAGAQAAA